MWPGRITRTGSGPGITLSVTLPNAELENPCPPCELIATIPVGDAPGWSEVAEEGRTCLIANTRSDELSIISIPKRAEVARLSIGNGPKHITVARIPQAVIAAFKSTIGTATH